MLQQDILGSTSLPNEPLEHIAIGHTASLGIGLIPSAQNQNLMMDRRATKPIASSASSPDDLGTSNRVPVTIGVCTLLADCLPLMQAIDTLLT